METDLMKIRRWLFEDFKVRAALLVPPLLEANPTMGAFDLMAAIEVAEAPLPLSSERKAYLLDQYLVTRWEAPVTTRFPDPVSDRPRKRRRAPAPSSGRPVPAGRGV